MASTEEGIISDILSDINVIKYIYNIIKYCGYNATQDATVLAKQNDVCLIESNIPEISRYAECMNIIDTTNQYTITYDANDITIIGGAALNLYDHALGGLKARRELKALDDYIKKKTSDIDIVWWPRPSVTNPIITSRSNAIIQLSEKFKALLKSEFDKNIDYFEKIIKKYVPDDIKSEKLIIDVQSFPTPIAGVININIVFYLNKLIFKLCDIIIHDSGLSQKYDIDGNEVQTLLFMDKDPIYCSPIPGQDNSISYLLLDDTYVAVPNILLFIRQQIFAFDIFIKLNKIKAFVNFKRVEFIKMILLSFKLNNSQNLKNIKDIFGTDNYNYINFIISEIESRENMSIKKYSDKILQLCDSVNLSTDTIINNLCYKIKKIYIDFDEYKNKSVKYLNRLQEQIGIVKKDYLDKRSKLNKLYNQVQILKATILKMKLDEYLDELKDHNLDNKINNIEKEINRYKTDDITYKPKYINNSEIKILQGTSEEYDPSLPYYTVIQKIYDPTTGNTIYKNAATGNILKTEKKEKRGGTMKNNKKRYNNTRRIQ
jgi:hypothetical protein